MWTSAAARHRSGLRCFVRFMALDGLLDLALDVRDDRDIGMTGASV